MFFTALAMQMASYDDRALLDHRHTRHIQTVTRFCLAAMDDPKMVMSVIQYGRDHRFTEQQTAQLMDECSLVLRGWSAGIPKK